MEVKQIYTLVNDVTGEILGKSDILAEDLSNIVDIGTEIFNASAVDAYVKSLVNHIGKVIFVNRVYSGSVPSLLMDGWEYGSVLEKITADLPEAVENDSWSLEDKKSYDVNIFHQPKVSAKFFNKRITFEIDRSFTEMQVKQSFSDAVQLNAFISMIQTAVENSLTLKIDSLIGRTINNFIGQTMRAEFPSITDGNYNAVTGIKAVNLLKLYNDSHSTALTAEQSITTPEFIRFASYTMGRYTDRLSRFSSLFNIGGKERFTPADKLGVVLLSDFARAADAFLQSDTYHENFTKLPSAEIVPYWQGSGKDYGFASISDIHVNVDDGSGATAEIAASGILGVMYDRDALGVCNISRRVTSDYNAKAEFYTNFYKFDAGYFNDFNENFVVFFVA